MTTEEEFSGDPLSPQENKKLRRILRDEERMRWFWSTLRIWAGWGSVAVASVYASQDFIAKFLKALLAGFLK